MMTYILPDFHRSRRFEVEITCKEHGAENCLRINRDTKVWTLDVFPELKWEQMEIDKFELALDNLGIKHERIAIGC